MRFLLFFAFLILFGSLALCQDGLDFNDPYSESMGGISIHSSHVENPSLSTLIEDRQLSLSYKNHYFTNELNSWRSSFYSPTPWFAAGILLSWYGFEHYNSFRVGGNIGKSLSSSLAAGVGINLYSLYYTGCSERKNNLSVRIGASFTEKNLLISCWVANPFQTGFYNEYDEKEKLPVQFFAGFRLSLTEETQWSVEVESSDFSWGKIKTGFEYRIKSFAARCGVFGKPVVPTAGIGFFFSDFSLELSGQYHNILGVSVGCGLGWRFR